MSFFEFFETPPAKEFYNGLNKLTADFGEVTKQAETKNQQLNKLIDELSKSIGKIVNKQHKKAEKTTLFDLLYGQISLTEKTVNSFVVQAQVHSHNTQFRDEFNDSVLIFIYGKVKAGKSSLGNFVAKHPANKKAKPQFFIYDKAGQKQTQAKLEEIHDEGGFEIKATQATDSIQGFRMNGFTWIDSPGLHTLDRTHDEITKRYVEAADLVLYITSSDSPARASDVAEIVYLVGTKNKTVCIVLSKSDWMEEDEVDGEFVQLRRGKSSYDRNLQENHVRSELKKELGEQLAQRINHIHSCSTLLGHDGINGNKTAWAQSNMDTIFSLLHTEAITNAITNKGKVPRERFNGLISVIVGQKNQRTPELNDLFSGLDSLAQKAKSEEITLQNRAWDVNTKLRPKLQPTVKACLDKHLQQYGDNENTAKENANALNQALTIAITTLVEDALTLAIQQSIAAFDEALPLSLRLGQLPAFKEKFKEITVKTNNLGMGAILGGLVGGFFAGIMTGGLGAAQGAALGAALGGGAGALDSDAQHVTQKVGDNREEMQQQIISRLEKTLPPLVDNQLKTISHDYFGAIHAIATDIQHQVTTIEEKVHALRF